MNKLEEKIISAWESETYEIPKYVLCRHNQKTYFTISDNQTVFFFMSMTKKVFVAVKSKCEIVRYGGIILYLIKDSSALQIVSCANDLTPIQIFVSDEIVGRYGLEANEHEEK